MTAKAIRPLSSSELDAVAGGDIDRVEHASNNAGPPVDMSEQAHNWSGGCLPWQTETTDPTGRAGVYCMKL